MLLSYRDTDHLLLKFMVNGDNLMGFVCGIGTGRADAHVVGPAVHIQETFVFLTNFVFQVESWFNQTMRHHCPDLEDSMGMSGTET